MQETFIAVEGIDEAVLLMLELDKIVAPSPAPQPALAHPINGSSENIEKREIKARGWVYSWLSKLQYNAEASYAAAYAENNDVEFIGSTSRGVTFIIKKSP